LFPELAEDAAARARFKREAKAAASVGHPSIVDIHDVGTSDNGSLFLVMEHLQGESLAASLERRSRLDISLGIYVACQVLSALDAAHAQGVVHRDLKPDNIFLVDARQTLPLVKLMDFGISKIISPDDTRTGLTKTGASIGTPHYMSPEQATGKKAIDHRCDIYSVGVVLYRSLTGDVPYYAENYLALIHEIAFGEMEQPRDLRPEIPVELEEVISTALSREREERFSSAKEMFDALYPLLEGSWAERVSLPSGIERGPDGQLQPGEPVEEQKIQGTVDRVTERSKRRSAARSSRRRSMIITYSGWVGLAVVIMVVLLKSIFGGPATPEITEPPAAILAPDAGRSIEPQEPSVEQKAPSPPAKESVREEAQDTPMRAKVEEEPVIKQRLTPSKATRPVRRPSTSSNTEEERRGLSPKQWDGTAAQ
jgi:serine/threonine-protein kinase